MSVTAERLKIKSPSIVEKDYYVTQVIHALSNIENEYFRVVFAGGTCLAKAHKIVRRMSEDVDFKIQLKNNSLSFSTRLSEPIILMINPLFDMFMI